MNYPIGGAFKAGFNLGGEFINIYLGLGGTFFNGYNPSVNNSKGLRALRIMKKITTIILVAGKSSRFKGSKSKIFH